MIIFETNMGEIHITVDAENAPISAKNFTDYVEAGFFNDTIFHKYVQRRIIASFYEFTFRFDYVRSY